MHASNAFVNGAGHGRRNRANRNRIDSLALLNTLLAAPTSAAGAPDQRELPYQKPTENENQAESVSRPGGFSNDPDDPKNPNEVRERYLEKVRP